MSRDCLIIKKRSGFTLAEVLLVITIIGIVAMQTIPTLFQNIKNQEAVVGVKKAMSEFSQAYKSFDSDGTTMDTVWAGNDQHANVLNQFCTKLNCIKNCGTGTGCFPDTIYTYLDGTPWRNVNTYAGYAKVILADGTSLLAWDGTGNCTNDYGDNSLDNTCGILRIDINGSKGPNQFGRDLFAFYMTRNGTVPLGSNNDTNECTTTGFGCASKVLTDGAVTY